MTNADEITQAEQEYQATSAEHARLQQRAAELCGPGKPSTAQGDAQAYSTERRAAMKDAREAGERLIAASRKLATARGFDTGWSL